MARRPVETAVAVNSDRNLSPAAFTQMSKSIYGSGVVDYIHVFDQMMGWWPKKLWTTANSPLAAFSTDTDSYSDPAAMAAYAAAAAPGAGLTISIDAIRRGPAEMMQTMLTLANLGQGRAILQIGAGELKQTKPFGWKRSEGIKRLEDHLRYYDKFWKNEGPIDAEGHFWTYDKAWIGGARQHRPRTWVLGGGPKLIDLGTSYADGFATSIPSVCATPDRVAELVRSMGDEVERKGRDRDTFDFGGWFVVLIHDDPEVIKRALSNPLIRWYAAVLGRLSNADWDTYGIEPVFPRDWHYSMKFLPHTYTDEVEIARIVDQVTPKMCETTYICGNAAEVAAKIQGYVDAGCNWVDVCDLLPMVLEPGDSQAGLGRAVEVCAQIKKKQA